MKIKEFRSIAEASPVVLRVLQQELGKTAGELKKMSADGKLTSDLVSGALLRSLTALEIQASKLPATLGGSFNVLKNEFTIALGKLNEGTGLTRDLTNAILGTAAAIRDYSDSAITYFNNVVKFVVENIKVISALIAVYIAYRTNVFLAAKATIVLEAATKAASVATAIYNGVMLTARTGMAIYSAVTSGATATVGLFTAGVIASTFATRALAGAVALATGGISVLVGFLAFKAFDKFSDSIEGAANSTTDLTRNLRDAKAQLAILNKEGSTEQDLVSLDSRTAIANQYTDELKSINDWQKKMKESGEYGAKEQADFKKKLKDLNELRDTQLAIQTEREKRAAKLKQPAGTTELDPNKKNKNQYEQELSDLSRVLGLRGKISDYDVLKLAAQEEYGKRYGKELSIAKQIVEKRRELAKTDAIENGNRETEKLNTVLDLMAKGYNYDVASNAASLIKTSYLSEEVALNLSITNSKLSQNIETNKQKEYLTAVNEFLQKGVDLEIAKELAKKTSTEQSIKELVALQRQQELLSQINKEKENPLKAFTEIDLSIFGSIGNPFSEALKGLSDLSDAQVQYSKDIEKTVEGSKERAQADKNYAKAEIRNIGNILGATKGFFKEKSAGYKVLSAAEKAYRAYELAMMIKNFAIEKGITLETIGIKLAGYAQTAIAAVASASTSIGALLGIGVTAGAVAPVAAAAGTPGPAAFAAFAAMAALVAAQGFGRGSSGSFAPTNEGTGTVFGDKAAKSESIKRSIDLLAENSKIELPITSAMLRSLQNIEANIGGLTNLVIRGGAGENLASGVSQGFKPSFISSGLDKLNKLSLGLIDPFGLVSGLFGKKVSIKGQGLFGQDQALGDITSSGFNLKEYVDINTKKKALGVTTSNKNSTQFGAASDLLSRQFALVFKGFYDGIKLAAAPLGENLDAVTSRLNSFVVSIGKINLQGLNGEEIQAKLEAVFGAAADNIAQAAIPGLEDFQKVGEGYFETVVRISSGVEEAAQALSIFGVNAVNFKDIVLKQGDVGAEIVRQSLVIANGISGVSDILNSASVDSVSSIVELANTLYALRDNVIAIGSSFADVTVALVKGAGSIDRLSSGLDSFFNDFLTAEEQSSELARRTARDFAKLGLAVPANKEAFKSLVRGIDTTTEAGQKLFGSVIALAPAFSEMSSAAEKASSSLNDAARSLYETIRDARVQSLVPTQQLDVLLSEYQSAVNLATQSTGQNLADNAGTVNSLIKPLLDSIKSVFASGPEAQRLIDSVLGQAKNVADKAANEAFTYQDESLRLLQAQVNELEAIRSALSVGVFTPVSLGSTNNVVPITTAGNTGSLNVNVQNAGDNTAIVTALTESNAHAAALVRLQQAANQQIIAKLTEMEVRLDGLESAASLAASA